MVGKLIIVIIIIIIIINVSALIFLNCILLSSFLSLYFTIINCLNFAIVTFHNRAFVFQSKFVPFRPHIGYAVRPTWLAVCILTFPCCIIIIIIIIIVTKQALVTFPFTPQTQNLTMLHIDSWSTSVNSIAQKCWMIIPAQASQGYSTATGLLQAGCPVFCAIYQILLPPRLPFCTFRIRPVTLGNSYYEERGEI